jgi:hypothetical protein
MLEDFLVLVAVQCLVLLVETVVRYLVLSLRLEPIAT